ncbi:hypothetical protein QUA54_31170 [Microcoleus sp. MOSTC5]|uniref:hypothetical protein n=1 Tax=Microcoleus sp. MOSTC5 TaxID=3055378 RepID=UPI002FD79092
MKTIIRWSGFACFLLTASYIYGAYAEDCRQHLQAGTSYRTWHQGPTLAFSGQITIDRTYQCPEGICFSAKMSFDNYNGGMDIATGFWAGSRFELRRYVAAGNNTQMWSGQCIAKSVRGNWYIENEQSNKGQFSITY